MSDKADITNGAFEVVATGHTVTRSDDIVMLALTADPANSTIYAVYRRLERESDRRGVSITNQCIADEMALSERHVGRCIRVLERIGVVRQHYPQDGNKAGRSLEVVYNHDAWTLRVLEGLIARQVKIDLRQATVAHEPTGREINATTRSLKAIDNSGTHPCPKDATSVSGGCDPGVLRGRKEVIVFNKASKQLSSCSTKPSSCSTSSSSSNSPIPPLSQSGGQKRDRGVRASEVSSERAAEIQQVFDAWQRIMGFTGRRLTDARRGKINARLNEKFTVDQLIAVAEHMSKSAYHRGQNDAGRAYDDIENIYRNAARCERALSEIERGIKPRGTPDRLRTDLVHGDGDPDVDVF